MTPIRRTGALAALALTLVLVACSTPDDLDALPLEPQFGTADNDSGIDVAYPSSGRIYVLSEQTGESPPDEFQDRYTKTILSRYDGSGTLTWTKDLITNYCDYECNQVNPRTVLTDTRGFVYVLVRDRFTGEMDAYPPYTTYYLYKYDSSGNQVASYPIGDADSSYPEVNQVAVDVAVDVSGNIYAAVAEVATGWGGDNSSDRRFVAKYSPSNQLLWQRPSTVGTPASISVSSNGNVYVGGSTGVAKYLSSGNLSWTKPGAATDIAAVGTNTVYARNLSTVRKLDANNKQLWSKAQTGLSGMVVGDMTTDSSGNVYLTGKYGPSSNRDVFTRKLAASTGATSFTKTFSTTAYDDALGVATITGSDIFISGASQGRLAPPYQGRLNSNDAYLRKLSSGGDPIWTR